MPKKVTSDLTHLECDRAHYPLRETLMQQTGNTVVARKQFLGSMHQKALCTLLHTWQAEEVAPPAF